jgi:hypothetical protein
VLPDHQIVKFMDMVIRHVKDGNPDGVLVREKHPAIAYLKHPAVVDFMNQIVEEETDTKRPNPSETERD